MTEPKNFKPLAGRTYAVKFKFDEPKHFPPSEDHPEWGESWSWGIIYWDDPANFKLNKPGVDAYWSTKGALYSLLSAIGIGRGGVIALKKSEELNENTGKTYPIYEVKFNGQVYKSQDYASRPPIKKSSGDKPSTAGVNALVNLNNAEALMGECLVRAERLLFKIGQSGVTIEDVRNIAVSMFIAVSNGRTIENIVPPEQEETPPVDDGDAPPRDDDESLPF